MWVQQRGEKVESIDWYNYYVIDGPIPDNFCSCKVPADLDWKLELQLHFDVTIANIIATHFQKSC